MNVLAFSMFIGRVRDAVHVLRDRQRGVFQKPRVE